MLAKQDILAGLKKVGPYSPGALAAHLEVEPGALGYHLKKLLDAKELKSAGTTANRRIALPDQQFEDETDERTKPAKPRKPKARRGAADKKTRRAKARKAPRPRAAELFLPACDADSRLVIVNGGAVQHFTEEQTAAIATLLAGHYED